MQEYVAAPPVVKASKSVPVVWGAVILGLTFFGAIAAVIMRWADQDLSPTPSIAIEEVRGGTRSQPCRVGQACAGPSITAEDPEGETLTYKFYDRATGEPIGQPIMADSGATVTPNFKFDEPGDKQLYMVVEDGAGHTSKDYPIIVPVE